MKSSLHITILEGMILRSWIPFVPQDLTRWIWEIWNQYNPRVFPPEKQKKKHFLESCAKTHFVFDNIVGGLHLRP